MKHQNNFDLLRLYAACQVMLSHSMWHLELGNSPLTRPLFYFPGVSIFFAISGFLVARSWLNPNMTFRVFADHRIRRIYPGLWFNLAVVFAVSIITGSILFAFPKPYLFIIGTALGGSDEAGQRLGGWIYLKDGFYDFFPSGVLWTLPVELGFYLLVPLVLRKRFQQSDMLKSIAVWAAATLVIQFLLPKLGLLAVFKFLWVFLVGAALSLYWEKVKGFIEGKAIYWIAAYLALFFPLQYFGLNTYFTSPSITGAITTIVLSIATISVGYSFSPLFGTLANKDISYGVYLWHMPVIWTMVKLGYVGSLRYAIVAYTLTIIIATVSWVCVERPFLRGKMPVIGRRERSGATSLPTPASGTQLELPGERA